MCADTIDRDGLRTRWAKALGAGKEGVHMNYEMKAPRESLPRGMVFYNTITALFLQGVMIGGYISSSILRGAGRLNNASGTQFLELLAIVFIIGAAAAAPKVVKSLILLVRH